MADTAAWGPLGFIREQLLQRDLVSVLTKRISSALREEVFQRDAEFIGPFLRLMGLWSRYFDGEVRGLTNVPAQRPILLVGNHSGGALVPDTGVLIHGWYEANGVDDPLTLLGLDAVFAIPGMARLCRRLGLVPASMENAERAIAAGHAVLVYPGGGHESFRPWRERNRIDLAGRTGFIRLALRYRLPVVPVVGHGGHDTLVVLSRGERLGRLLGMDRMRLPMSPIVLGLPFGVSPVTVPLPAKVTVQICEPLNWSRYGAGAADDPAVLAQCYREITGVMQDTLDALAREQPRPLVARWWRSATPPGLETGVPRTSARRTAAPAYAPQARGAHPVGVTTVTVNDDGRGRQLAVEVWYPAAAKHRGQDLDPAHYDRFRMLPALPQATAQAAQREAAPAAGRFPLLAFSHGYSSHRRQTTHLCTHLASHGYVVVAPDHAGNTVSDVTLERLQGVFDDWLGSDGRRRALRGVVESADQRPDDLRVVLDGALAGRLAPLSKHIDRRRIGVLGHSFGGWTALMMPRSDRRVGAVLAMAPSGGRSPVYPRHNPLAERLRFDWPRAVPTLILAAEHDSIVPLAGTRELFARLPAPAQLVVLRNADHLHFLDHVERFHEYFRRMPLPPLYRGRISIPAPIGELMPSEHAYRAVRTLAVAHFDAHLKRRPAARALLAGDIEALLKRAGIGVSAVRGRRTKRTARAAKH